MLKSRYGHHHACRGLRKLRGPFSIIKAYALYLFTDSLCTIRSIFCRWIFRGSGSCLPASCRDVDAVLYPDASSGKLHMGEAISPLIPRYLKDPRGKLIPKVHLIRKCSQSRKQLTDALIPKGRAEYAGI